MSQASKKGAIFDDALRYGRLWAGKQELPAEKKEKKRIKAVKQQGLF
ncbi:hypothetical protein [Klebsiella michiganensis]|nr:hypothetical protein [Klebsiella michiganensis]